VGRLEALASDVLRRGLSVRTGKGVVRVRARYFHAAAQVSSRTRLSIAGLACQVTRQSPARSGN
jgi:hypothetical protein